MDEIKRMPSIHDDPCPVSLPDRTAFVGKKPNKVVQVPLDNQRPTLLRELIVLINDIKVDTGCIVISDSLPYDKSKITSFNIFGAGPGVEKAVQYLNQWITKSHGKSSSSSAWAKIPAFEYNKEHNETMERLENEWKERFRGPIPTGDDEAIPQHTATVEWPAELIDQSLSPRDVFGNKLERLDKLRLQDEVWIALAPHRPGEQWHIEITGCYISAVNIAKEHLDTLIDKVLIDAGIQQTLHVVLDEREGINIELQLNETWWPNHADKVVPRLVSATDLDMDPPGSFRQQDFDDDMLLTIRDAIARQLGSIRYRTGSYDFLVRLGCLALSSKHVSQDNVGQSLPKKTFCRLINGKFELDVKKWLADDDTGHLIYNRLILADDILEPTKPGVYYGRTPASLGQTRPTLQGTWVFRDPNSTGISPPHSSQPIRFETLPQPRTSLLVVQIDWTEDEEGKYEKGSPSFYKLDLGDQGPKKNMDINLLELRESRGWQFALESMTSLHPKSVSPILTGFAEQITLKRNYDESSTDSFAEWNTTPTVKNHLLTGRLKKIYAFGIKKTCYKAELTATWYPRQRLPVWGLDVRHSEWANHLAELEYLPVGNKATWGDTISTFFPDDGQSASYVEDEGLCMKKLDINKNDPMQSVKGLRLFLGKLMKISEVVSSATNEGGVQI